MNPDEGVWRNLKRAELRNVICADLEEMSGQFWAAVERLLDKPHVLPACIREQVSIPGLFSSLVVSRFIDREAVTVYGTMR